jgi:hypothetical protein
LKLKWQEIMTNAIFTERTPAGAAVTGSRMVEMHLIVPANQLSLLSLSHVLRITPLLLAFRALSRDDPVQEGSTADWQLDYRQHHIESGFLKFVQYLNGEAHKVIFDLVREEQRKTGTAGFAKVDIEPFEDFLYRRYPTQLPDMLRLREIRKGSYDFVFTIGSLVSIFALQDYSVLKDVVQWLCGALQSVASSSRPSHSPELLSRRSRIELTPAIIQTLQTFDDVVLEEELSEGKSVLRIRLVKRADGA